MSFKRCDWKIVTLVTDPGGVKLYGAYLAQYGHGLQFWESPSESTVSTKIPRVCRRIWVLKSWRYALPSFQALRLSIGACQRWVQECIVGSGDSSGGTYFMEHTHVQNIGSTYCTVEAVWRDLELDSWFDLSTRDRLIDCDDWWVRNCSCLSTHLSQPSALLEA